MSTATQARHRKPSSLPAAQGRPSVPRTRVRHRKPSALQGKPAKATAVTALAMSAAAASAAVTHWPAGTSGHPAMARVSTTGVPSAGPGTADSVPTDGVPPNSVPPDGAPPDEAGLAGQAKELAAQRSAAIYHLGISLNTRPNPQPKGRHHRRPTAPVVAPPPSSPPQTPSQAPSQALYSNPLRAVTGLVPERVDMGIDFGGSGPVYPVGDAVITNATGDSSGWPGGGWITYRLTDGPDAGLMVYVAEDVQPAVAVGEVVTPSTVIANMYNGGTGIETGWAMPDGASAESQLAEAGGISAGGPFPTMVGLSFENLLRSLGVPASPDAAGSGYGTLPSGYPPA